MLDLLTTAEAAALLRVQPVTLRQWRHRGRGPRFVRLGPSASSHVRYRRGELERWLGLS